LIFISFRASLGSPDAKVGTAKHKNILIYDFALFQLLFSSQRAGNVLHLFKKCCKLKFSGSSRFCVEGRRIGIIFQKYSLQSLA
jgi:hypothetical protein